MFLLIYFKFRGLTIQVQRTLHIKFIHDEAVGILHGGAIRIYIRCTFPMFPTNYANFVEI